MRCRRRWCMRRSRTDSFLFFEPGLFTAGPKWLGVQLEAPQLRAAGAAGGKLGLLGDGAILNARLAVIGLTGAVLGLGWIVGLFWR